MKLEKGVIIEYPKVIVGFDVSPMWKKLIRTKIMRLVNLTLTLYTNSTVNYLNKV